MRLLLQLVVAAIVTTAAYGLVALGFSLVFSVTRVLHFAHAGIMVVPPYVYYSLSKHVEPVVALIGALVLGVLLSLIVEEGVYRPMQKRSATSMALLAASLGVLTLLHGLMGAIWGTTPLYLDLPVPRGSISLGSVKLNYLDIAIVIVATVVIAVVLPWLSRSRTGRTLLAVAEEPNVAATVGISERRARQIAQAVGVSVSTLAMLYLGSRSGLIPAMGLVPLLFAFAGAVVGGLGRIDGSIVGVALLIGISTLTTAWLPTFWTVPIAFVVLVVFLFARPT
ncbi:MAG: branched-chain amino acid ABC transporter permease, partial [Thermomicrobiales bacterium]